MPQEPLSLPIAALAGGSLIFILVIIVLFLAVAYGFYTFKGSAINAHSPQQRPGRRPWVSRTQRSVGAGSNQRGPR